MSLGCAARVTACGVALNGTTEYALATGLPEALAEETPDELPSIDRCVAGTGAVTEEVIDNTPAGADLPERARLFAVLAALEMPKDVATGSCTFVKFDCTDAIPCGGLNGPVADTADTASGTTGSPFDCCDNRPTGDAADSEVTATPGVGKSATLADEGEVDCLKLSCASSDAAVSSNATSSPAFRLF